MNNEIMSVSLAEQKIKQELIKANLGIQKFLDAEMKLVYNIDNLQPIADTIKLGKDIDKKAKAEHKRLKQAAWDECVAYDGGLKAITMHINPALVRIEAKYTQLCKDLEEQRKKNQKEKERLEAIKEAINTNVMDFSNRVAECDSYKKVVDIERVINLELANEKKYQEYLPDLRNRLDLLKPAIKTLKELYQQDSKQGAEIEKAIEKGEDGVVYDLSTKQDELQETIQQQKIAITESASNSYSSPTETAEEILPETNVKRRSWAIEVTDILKLQRAKPEFVSLEANMDAIKKYLKQLRDNGELKGKDEIVIPGLRFYIEKTYA